MKNIRRLSLTISQSIANMRLSSIADDSSPDWRGEFEDQVRIHSRNEKTQKTNDKLKLNPI